MLNHGNSIHFILSWAEIFAKLNKNLDFPRISRGRCERRECHTSFIIRQKRFLSGETSSIVRQLLRLLNPLVHRRFFDRYFKVLWGGGIKQKKNSKGHRQQKDLQRIFRYGCLKIILSKRQNTREGGEYSGPPYGRRG